MKTKISLILILIILFNLSILGQINEPLDIAKKIFGKDSLTNIENYISGEYKGSPNGRDLKEGSTTKFLILEQNEDKAVISLTILDSLGKGIDTYLHFEKDKTWKIVAFRALAMTGIIQMVKYELENMTPLEIDEIISSSKNKKKDGHGKFSSKSDYDFQLGNANLTLELDDNIAQHFLNNQKEFERLKDLALIQLDDEKMIDERSIKLIENYKVDYQKIYISSVSTGGYELGNSINFLIGGMIDNSVGYIFVEDEKDIPEMNPSRIIMIREIGNGWYIYKTT